MSDLLKYARARDDTDFVSRIAAAMTVRAQEIELFELSPPSRALCSWVLENPMQVVDRMVAHVSTSPGIAANVTVSEGTVDASTVPDADIQYTVNEKWDAVAGYLHRGTESTTA
ncbi:hypothetical protein FJV46_10735 [Arthrobacter agilis]|uniref:hypothetical protein n=1 Tax=Arthrobacter agilis TaxID=37921 RepID=UPI000B363998|nr:hypothetical protein [Arthrobacter agilis]OUM44148.1 hypothetical protein B8W74_04550 [Arthrobacter agilis]PPB46524.1 hypothetical protein CI784_06845 [Arthrobacter agilis]TPV23820.1 hypothetical protein FJV46_10735 [Arthrobacter agilis]VDR32555.1 Uncharacterised protein [Arthrobacter agilis]